MHMQVPLQRHLADGRLFMCTNMLYLLAGLPPLLTPEAADALAPYRRTEVDLFQGTFHCYPGGWVGGRVGGRGSRAGPAGVQTSLHVRSPDASSLNALTLNCTVGYCGPALPRRLHDAAVVPARDGRGAS